MPVVRAARGVRLGVETRVGHRRGKLLQGWEHEAEKALERQCGLQGRRVSHAFLAFPAPQTRSATLTQPRDYAPAISSADTRTSFSECVRLRKWEAYSTMSGAPIRLLKLARNILPAFRHSSFPSLHIFTRILM